jgi:hypothetical protein
MNYKIEQLKTSKFEPFRITIDIENAEDLNEIFARFNVDDKRLVGYGYNGRQVRKIAGITYNLFSDLVNECRKAFD